MFHKSYITFLFVITFLIAGSVSVFGQYAPLSGTVELKKADGTREPVLGAVVDVYRLDIKSGNQTTKSGKNGLFAFAGLQLGGNYILAISAPGCAPTTLANVKAGQEKLLVTMDPGDGGKFTEDQIRKGAVTKPGTAPQGELTAEQKKAKAEYEAQKKDIEEKNSKALKSHEIATAALKDGNDAFNAKNYDLAITKYDEGIATDPEFVGSAPTFYTNRAAALIARSVDRYNKVVKSTDPTEKVEGFGLARKDLADSADGLLKAWNIIKNAAAADAPDPMIKLGVLRASRDTFRKAVQTEQVDPTVIEAAKILIPEYISVETDAAKKAEANLIFADLYRVTADSPNAITAYKKILESTPDDPDALAGAGLSLVNLGYINTDKAMLQEGVNYLQKFVNLAPDAHKLKADAAALIESLKKEQNVTPQKTPPKKKP